MVFEAGFWVFLVSRKANLSVELGKCQLLRYGGPISPFEHHIHQQESDWLQGSGSPFTTSDTTIPCPHPPLPSHPSATLSFPIHVHLFSFHPAGSLPIFTSVSSPSFTLSLGFCSSFSLRHHRSFPPSLPQAGQ